MAKREFLMIPFGRQRVNQNGNTSEFEHDKVLISLPHFSYALKNIQLSSHFRNYCFDV